MVLWPEDDDFGSGKTPSPREGKEIAMGGYRWYQAALVVTLAASFAPALGDPAPEPPAREWKLVWSDEFDGRDIDRTKWDFDLGNGFYTADKNWIGGWGNGELQYYTREPKNAFVQDGMLHLRAVKESYKGCGYTSARLKTRKQDGSPLFAQKYGKFVFRARLPTGKGIWPALWMLPQDEKKYGGWAASGELDVMEARGQQPTKVLGTLHFGSRWPHNTHVSKEYVLPDAGTIADFHVYAVEWEPGEVRWSVDDRVYSTQSFWWSSSKADGGKGVKPARESDLNPWPAPFDQPFYLLMNVAVGGQFLGNPDKTTAFPVEMVVDYVRVYDRVGGYGEPKPRGKGKLPFGKP
jgi:beta-glucanase (GH16 family)